MYKGSYLSAIVTAAGSGTRMNLRKNKPYISLNGKEVLKITLETIVSIKEIDEILLVIRSEDKIFAEKILKELDDMRIRIIPGGNSREDSTYRALMSLNKKSKLVLTHDGVRPFASKKLFLETLKEMDSYKAAITATRSKDTVKVSNDRGEVDFTPNRDYVYNVQTPQAFETGLIRKLYKAYIKSEAKITDDSQLFEFFDRDEPVKIVEGEYSNIKITTREDIIFAKAYLESIKGDNI